MLFRGAEATGESVPPVALYGCLNEVNRKLMLPLEERLPISARWLRHRATRSGRSLFNWANNLMVRRMSSDQVDGEVMCGSREATIT